MGLEPTREMYLIVCCTFQQIVLYRELTMGFLCLYWFHYSLHCAICLAGDVISDCLVVVWW